VEIDFFQIILFIPAGLTGLIWLLSHIYLWQVKEYRLDRFLAYIREFGSTNAFAGKIFPFFSFVYFAFFYDIEELNFLFTIVGIISYFEFVYSQKRKLILPSKSFRNLLIFLLSIFIPFIGGLILSGYFNKIFYIQGILTAFICLLVLFLPINIFISIKITSIFSCLKTLILIKSAKDKLKKFPNLKIIGITGSFGKSSVKENTLQILKNNFIVQASFENFNTKIGALKSFLGQFNKNLQIYIQEIGAYKKGEIKSICDIFTPDISVITAISDQHLALFGSKNKLIEAKFEIAKYSKKNSVLVLNMDDKNIFNYSKRFNNKKIFYSISNPKADIFADEINIKNDEINFKIIYKSKKINFNIKGFGKFNVSNVLPAVACGILNGMTLDECSFALSKFWTGKIKLLKSKYEFSYFDDSYSSNSQGFIEAVKVLKQSNFTKKVLITNGIIELGENKNLFYEKLLPEIQEGIDFMLTGSNEFYNFFKDKINIKFILKPEEIINLLNQELTNEDVVLVEGRNTKLINLIKS